MHSGALIAARPAWSERLGERLHPGAHVILLTSDEHRAIEARKGGFELRDTLLLLWPQTTSFAFLLRVPVAASSVLEQVAGTATGGVNIGACRVNYASESDKTPVVGKGPGGLNPGAGANFPHFKENWGMWSVNHDGRWPPNVALIHGPACRRVGEARIDGHKGYPNGPGGSSTQFSQKGTPTTRKDAWQGHADADGKETIDVWDCQPNCPAKLLDQQTSDLKPRANKEPSLGGGGMYGHPKMNHPFISYGDAGGASRFFPQFASPWELLDWLRTLIRAPGDDLLEEL